MSIEISLHNFDGPLDLLLHLIKTNAMDISDIQMVEITAQYLAVIEQMQQLNLDVAGEFLLMAATLIHIKSRLLLPVVEEIYGDEEELDPRAELVKRLLEYQRYKDAANSLDLLPCLRREVFLRQFFEADADGGSSGDGGEVGGSVSVGLYQLAAAFHQLLRQSRVEFVHDIVREQLSVADFVHKILDQLGRCGQQSFADLFSIDATRQEMVVTFLAMLELVKMRMVKISQNLEFQPIWLSLAVSSAVIEPAIIDEEALGYG